MYLKAKAVRTKVKEIGKQINKGGLEILNKKVDEYINELLVKQTSKRITEKTIIL